MLKTNQGVHGGIRLQRAKDRVAESMSAKDKSAAKNAVTVKHHSALQMLMSANLNTKGKHKELEDAVAANDVSEAKPKPTDKSSGDDAAASDEDEADTRGIDALFQAGPLSTKCAKAKAQPTKSVSKSSGGPRTVPKPPTPTAPAVATE